MSHEASDSVLVITRQLLAPIALVIMMCALSATAQSIPHGNAVDSKRQMRAASTNAQTTSNLVHDLDEAAVRKLIGRGGGGRSRPLMLYLWDTACESCRTKLSEVQSLSDEFHERGLDVVIVSVSPIDSQEELSQYLLDHKIHVPAYLLLKLDDELAEDIFKRDWEVTVPAAFFYDRAGQVLFAETDIKNVSYDVLKRDANQALGIQEKR